MYTCPSCHERTISFMHKWLSWNAAPAKCHACRKGCCIATVDSTGLLALCLVVVTLFGFAAVAVHAAYPLVAGVVFSVFLYLWRTHRANLVHVSLEEAQTAKRSAWLMLLLSLFPGFFG